MCHPWRQLLPRTAEDDNEDAYSDSVQKTLVRRRDDGDEHANRDSEDDTEPQ